MKYIKLGFAVVITLIISLVAIRGALVGAEHPIAAADVNDNIQQLLDVEEHNDIDIWDYVDDFNQQLGAYSFGGSNHLFGANVSYTSATVEDIAIITASGDDPIVSAVPREYFMTSGTHFHMGNSYGFCVKTYQENNCYYSTVILLQNLVTHTGDVYAYRVTTKAKINYCYVTQDKIIPIPNKDLGGTTNVQVYLSNVGSAVIPVLQKDGLWAKVDNSTLYNIGEIYFDISVFNQNELNQGDVGYVATQDAGYYAVNANTFYHLTEIIDNQPQVAQATLTTLVDIVICFLPQWLGLGYILYNDLCALNDAINALPLEVVYNENTSMYGFSNPIYVNSEDQISYYGALQKRVLHSIGDSSSQNIFCEPLDYVQTNVTYSHKEGVGYINYSRVDINMIMSIKDNRLNTFGLAYSNEVIHHDINSPQITNLTIADETDYYMTSYADKRFSFTAPYNATYVLDVDGDVGDVTIGGVTVSPVNGFYTFEGAANTSYQIILNNNGNSCSGTVNIDVKEGSNSFAPGQSRLIKYTVPNEGLFKWQTNNSDVVIDNLLMSDLSIYSIAGGIAFTDVANQTIPTDDVAYYVLAHNSAQTVQTASVYTTNGEPINQNSTKSVWLTTTGYYFMRFIPSSASYCLTTVGQQGSNVTFHYAFYDNASTTHSFEGTNTLICMSGLQSAVPIYIGAKVFSGQNTYADILIKNVDQAYSWIIDGEPIVGQVVSLGKNYTHSVALRVNGDVDAENLFITNGHSPNIGLNIDGVYVSSSANVGVDSGIVFAFAPDTNYLIPYSLTVNVKQDDRVNLEIVQTQTSQGIHWWLKSGVPAPVDSFTITFATQQNNTQSITINPVSLTEGTFYLQGSQNAYRWRSTYVSSITSGNVVYDVSIGQTIIDFDSWFGGGTGTASDPNLITYPWQFNNIYRANTNGVYFKQTQNLSFSGVTTKRDVSFYGTYDADWHNISGISLYITYSNQTYIGGLFDRNYGTIQHIFQYHATVSVTSATAATVSVGGVLGYNASGASVQVGFAFCTVCSDSKQYTSRIGGLVGYNSGTVTSGTADNMVVQGYCNMGGLVGYNAGTVNSAMVDCNIQYTRVSTASNCGIGGVAGYNTGTVYTVFVYSDIDITILNESGNKTNRPRVGLLVGENNSGTVTVAGDTPFGSIDADDLIPVCQTYINFNGNIGYNH